VAGREASAGSTRRPAAAGDSGSSAACNPQEFISHSGEETIAKGREIAAKLRPPVIVMLSGELGSGKTTLTKGIISGLGAAREEDVTSPTFTLVHVFQNDSLAGSKYLPVRPPDRQAGQAGSPHPYKVYHVDLYRVENFQDLESLGLEDALGEQAVVIIEWPERFTFRTDWPRVEIRLEHAGGDSRRIAISGLSLENRLE
jgi:tRNA threonylcarbamoyladenosine biosynthesis protein TsaE